MTSQQNDSGSVTSVKATGAAVRFNVFMFTIMLTLAIVTAAVSSLATFEYHRIKEKNTEVIHTTIVVDDQDRKEIEDKIRKELADEIAMAKAERNILALQSELVTMSKKAFQEERRKFAQEKVVAATLLNGAATQVAVMNANYPGQLNDLESVPKILEVSYQWYLDGHAAQGNVLQRKVFKKPANYPVSPSPESTAGLMLIESRYGRIYNANRQDLPVWLRGELPEELRGNP